MQDLKTIADKIQRNKNIAETDLSQVDPRTRAAKKGHVVRAKEDLKQLYMDYKKALIRQSAFILVTGTKAQLEKYVKTAEEDFACYPIKGEAMYEDVMNEMPKQYFQRPVDSHFFSYFMAKFGDLALDIDIIGHRPMAFNSKYHTQKSKGLEGALDVIKRAFNDQVGGEVVGYYAIDRVAKKAANEGFASKVCPIVIYSEDNELVKELEKDLKRELTGNVFVVTLGTKVDKNVKEIALTNVKSATKESVEKSLLTIRENLK